MIIELLAAGISIFLVVSVLRSDTPPLHGVYAQAGAWYHVKRALFCVFYWLRQRRLRSRQDPRAFRYQLPQTAAGAGKQTSGYGERSHAFMPDMDAPQQLTDHPDAIDCAYFEGADSRGTCFIMRIGRRHGRRCEVWLSINMPDIGFYQLPCHPATMVYNTEGSSFCGGGLRFQCVEPMRKWRITFNGLMRKGLHNEWSDEKRDLLHVKFSFFWDALSDPFNFDTDISPAMLSDAIAREKWSKEYFQRLRDQHQTHYEQCGELRGVVKIEGSDEVKLRLKSIRDHSYGVRDWSSFHRYIVHFGYLEDGTFFHVNHICLPSIQSSLKCGYVCRPNAVLLPVTWTDLELVQLGENINPPQQYSFSFTAGGRTYRMSVHTEITPTYYHGDTWNNVIFEKICTFQREDDGVKGYGITEFCYRRPGGDCPLPPQSSVPRLQELVSAAAGDASNLLVLPFTHPAATVAALVGGKGCQLAQLTQMKQPQSFVVPAGFSLTIAAFQQQLRKSSVLKDRVMELEDTACGRCAGDVRVACERTVAEFLRTELTEEVRDAIDSSMRKMFGADTENKAFAVRSSAAGEDSAELSAAGQMDTLLGVKGLKQIHKAVAKCWASHFAHAAVEYRRQHGQPIHSAMAVVIQEMVPAQAAGVLFTRDPISGNPGLMVINANYGLGESVVSGLSEPDNICVRRQWQDEVTVVNKDVGSKKKQITVTSVGGTKTVDVSAEEMEKCSISNELILRLANIGIQLENGFSDPRDIEWAVAGDTIYLLQARPITALDQETEWEMLHEFDTPIAMDKELLTTANIGEMMPGAMTPLTISVFGRAIDWALQDMTYQQDLVPNIHKFYKYNGICVNHGLINMHYVHIMWEKTMLVANVKMAQLAIMGETIDDITDADLESYHGVRPLHRRVISAIKNFMNLKNSYWKTKKWGEKLAARYVIGENAKSASGLYDAIDDDLPNYYQCWCDTVVNSARSSSWASIVMSVLSRGEPNWTTEMYSDVAMLLSKCDDVYSADVPAALQELAKVIAESGKGQEFSKMSPEDAVRWLSSRGMSGASCHDHYTRFLSRHGHRCIREAEFREKSWQSEPAKLISVLQALVPSVSRARKVGNENAIEDIEEAIRNIKSPLTKGGRFALKFVLPRARKAVGGREWGKSVSIQMVEAFKQAYWRLANMMHTEGRLPDPDLLFFFTHDEIGMLLAERSGKLIAKGQRRRKLLGKQMDTKIERINIGHPVPVEEVDAEADYVLTSVTLKGLPVSQGVVRGIARVVTSLSDASAIQPGDILIVHYTDVGWSPYFPLISGLVTEIGGLVSHGAVVAREYGLPCIVNVKKATMLFRTGDQVILNGTLGTLEKLEDTEP